MTHTLIQTRGPVPWPALRARSHVRARGSACVQLAARVLVLIWLHAAAMLAAPALAADRAVPVATIAEAVVSGRLPQAVVDQLGTDSVAHVIVRLTLPAPFVPEPILSGAAVEAQRSAIAAAQAAVIAELDGMTPKPPRRLRSTPYLSLWGDARALTQLVRSKHVARVLGNGRREAYLQSSGVAGGVTPVQNGLGLLGSGQTIVVIDSGVDRTHPFLGGRVVSEACFSEGGGLFSSVDGVCPNGADTAFGVGAAAPCALPGCSHGTLVAGIAAGAPFGATTFSGVASNASIIAIQAFHLENDADDCPGATGPCVLASDSDLLQALERAFDLRHSHSIAAVNLSLGSGHFNSRASCDDDSSLVDAIANLTAADIAVVAASGNNAAIRDAMGNITGFTAGIGSPSCVTGVISVGSVDDLGTLAPSSQFGPLLSMLAVGRFVTTSSPGTGFEVASGTSLAAPQVSGALAALAGLDPSLRLATLRNRLVATGLQTADGRAVPALVRPRLQLDLAVENQEARPLPPSATRVVAATGRTLRLGWVDNARSEVTHRLTARVPGALSPARTLMVAGTNVTLGTLDALAANTEYDITVEACDAAARCSLPSMRLRARTANSLPTAPLNVRALALSTTSIELRWDSVSTNPVASFRIGHETMGAWTSITVPGAARSRLFTGLAPNRRYEFWIQSANADGSSARVDIAASTLSAGTVPAAPTDLRVCTSTGISSGCFANVTRVLWRDLAVDETRYEFESAVLLPGETSTGASFTRVTLPANAQSRDLSLVAGVRYAFRVRACNAAGCSAYGNTLVYTRL